MPVGCIAMELKIEVSFKYCKKIEGLLHQYIKTWLYYLVYFIPKHSLSLEKVFNYEQFIIAVNSHLYIA